jgi:hypothetical protein
VIIVLNILFFALLLVFIIKSSNGALVYEQAYAKEIAIIIDKANPNTEVTMDIKKGIEFFKLSIFF